MNGLTQTYLLMCTALGTPGNAGTYTATMATAAANAWMTGTDSTVMCGNGGNAATCLRRQATGMCATWCYTKAVAGYVIAGATCSCPNTSSSMWN